MRTKLAWLLLLPLGFAFGCDGDDNDGQIPGDDDDDDGVVEETQLRVIHLAPDAGELDVRIDAEANFAVDGLTFEEASAYRDIRVGRHQVRVLEAGTDDAVLESDIELDDDSDYTFVVWDELPDLEPLLLRDGTSGLAAGDLRLQVAHVAVGVDEVDLLDLSGATPTLLVEDLERGDVERVDVSEEVTRLGLDLDDDQQADLEFEIPDLGADRIVNVFAAADDQGNPFLLALEPDSTVTRIDPAEPVINAQLRLLHLGDEAGAVDIWVDSAPSSTVTNLEYLEGTEYIPVIPGMRTFSVVPRGGSIDEAVFSFTLDLQPDTDYSAALWDELGDLDVFDHIDDVSQLGTTNFRLHAIHLADALENVDVYRISPAPMMLLLDNFEFGGFERADLPAGTAFTIGVDEDEDGVVDLTFDLPPATAGEIVDLYVTSDATTGVFLAAHLEDGQVVTIEPTM